LSQEQVAKIAAVSRATYGGYETGKSEPLAGVLKRLADFFQTSIDNLMTADVGAPLFQQADKKPLLQDDRIRVLAITVGENERENIEFVPAHAIAGYSVSFQDPEFVAELQHFSLPKHTYGTYRAFEIKGESMPPIDDGYIVIGKYLEDWLDLKSGSRYILISKEYGVVFKRVLNEARQGYLTLLSDNPSFRPFKVQISEILEVWEMVSYIAFPKDAMSYDNLVFDKLFAIEQKLDALASRKS